MPHHPRPLPGARHLAILALAVALAVSLAACSGAGVGPQSSESSTVRPSTAPSWGAEPADAAVAMRGEALAVLEDPAADPAIGVSIPTVTGVDLEGEPIVIGPADGPMAILLVAHWCPHCRAEVALLSDHLRVNGLPDDVRVVAISTAIDPGRGNYPSARWLAEAEWPVDTLIDDADSTALRAFGMAAFPSLVLVDEEGAVSMRVTGGLDGTTFEQAIELLRGG